MVQLFVRHKEWIVKLKGRTCVIYWLFTIKRCTGVNKRKNSRSKGARDNYIIRCLGRFKLVGVKMPEWEPDADRGLWALRDPRLSNPSHDEEEVLLWSEELGVNIAVCPRLQLISHIQETSPYQEYIFIKKCVRSFIEVRHYCWLCLFLYLWLYMYYGIQHPQPVVSDEPTGVRRSKTQRMVSCICRQNSLHLWGLRN